MADIFAVQDEIAQAIASALRVQLSGGARQYTPPLAAYESYLRARQYLAAWTRESLTQSTACFNQAVALDPAFSLAHSGRAMALVSSVIPGLLPARTGLPMARAAAEKALTVDPESQEAHAVLGMVASFHEFDWEEAECQFRLAMAHEPVSPYVRWYYSFACLLPMARLREHAEESMRARRDDPLSFLGGFQYAWGLLSAGEVDAGEAQLRQQCELLTNIFQPFYLLGLSQMLRGAHREGLASAEASYAKAPWNMTASGLYAGALARAGQARHAEDLLQKLRPGDGYGAPIGLAVYHLVNAELDRAAEWAERAAGQRDPRLIALLALLRAPSRNILRSNSRWGTLAAGLRVPLEF
jgi:serine/threonine-protein kinase